LALAARVALPSLVIDSVGSIAEAEAAIAQHDGYRLVLLDLMLPDAQGFSGFVRLQHLLGGVPIVIVSAREKLELVETARMLGASGYLSKGLPLDQTLSALRAVLAGGTAFPAVRAEDDAGLVAMRSRIATLSGAQLRVLIALAGGRLNKQLAGELGVTEATIKAHLTAIFRKLGVNNRTQAILAVQPLLGGSAADPA
jgi:DNA-binding NarL/FixJ family response regulator